MKILYVFFIQDYYRLLNSLVFNHVYICLLTLIISFNYYYNILFCFYSVWDM